MCCSAGETLQTGTGSTVQAARCAHADSRCVRHRARSHPHCPPAPLTFELSPAPAARPGTARPQTAPLPVRCSRAGHFISYPCHTSRGRVVSLSGSCSRCWRGRCSHADVRKQPSESSKARRLVCGSSASRTGSEFRCECGVSPGLSPPPPPLLLLLPPPPLDDRTQTERRTD